jgi:SAM-dependent methyltransferase
MYDLVEEDFNHLLDESLEPRGPELLFDLAGALGLAPGATVLDLGCGEGRHSIELARRFGVVVHGVDPDPWSLDQARRELDVNAVSPGLGDLVRFGAGSAEHIPLDDASVDLVWCRDVLCLVDDLDLAYAECRRVLRDRGHVIVYQMFATDRLEPREAAELYAALDCVPTSMEPRRTETAIEAAGLRIDECHILGTEWGEFFEEQSGKAGRLLLHAARLLRDPERYVERFGQRNYEIKYGDCLWHIYRLLGKLSGRVFVLSPEP